MEYSLDGHNASLSAIRTVRVLRPLRAINRVPSKSTFERFQGCFFGKCPDGLPSSVSDERKLATCGRSFAWCTHVSTPERKLSMIRFEKEDKRRKRNMLSDFTSLPLSPKEDRHLYMLSILNMINWKRFFYFLFNFHIFAFHLRLP